MGPQRLFGKVGAFPKFDPDRAKTRVFDSTVALMGVC